MKGESTKMKKTKKKRIVALLMAVLFSFSIGYSNISSVAMDTERTDSSLSCVSISGSIRSMLFSISVFKDAIVEPTAEELICFFTEFSFN